MQATPHPFRIQSTSAVPIPTVFDPLPNSPKSKILSPNLVTGPAPTSALDTNRLPFQPKLPHPYRSSIASSFDSTYQEPYSFCQTFAFPHPALRKGHLAHPKSTDYSRRVPDTDELSFRGVLKENHASQKEREEWERYRSDGVFTSPRRRRVFSEADGGSREGSPKHFRGGSGSMDAATAMAQPPSPTAHCSDFFSHLLHRRSDSLAGNSSTRHSNPEFHLFRRHSRKRSDATVQQTLAEKPIRRSASEETLVIRSISPEVQLGTAISNTSPAPSSPARIVSENEKEFVALPPRLRLSFSKSTSDFSPRRPPPPVPLETPDNSPNRRRGRAPVSEGQSRLDQEARLNLLLHQKLVAENDARSPTSKSPLRLNKELPPIVLDLSGSTRLSRKNTLEKAPDAPLPPLPTTPLLITPPHPRLSDPKSNGSLNVPESPLDRDMLGGNYISSPRTDRDGSEGTSILDMDDEDDLYYRNLVSAHFLTYSYFDSRTASQFYQAPRTDRSVDYPTMAIPRTPPSYSDSAKATFPLVFRKARSMQELKSRRNGGIEGTHAFLSGLGIGRNERGEEMDDESSMTRSESWRTAEDSQSLIDVADFATTCSHDFLGSKYSTIPPSPDQRAVRFAREKLEDLTNEVRDVSSRQSFIDMNGDGNATVEEEISFIDLTVTPVSTSTTNFALPNRVLPDDPVDAYRTVANEKRKSVT